MIVPLTLCCTVQDRKLEAIAASERSTDARTVIYTGAATTYESFGVECIAQRLQKQRITVASVIKDGDSNALAILTKYYPGIMNILDKNHYIKNIPKHIQSATRSKAPELRGRSEQIQQQINRILGVIHRFPERSLEWRKALFLHLGMHMVCHLCGDHSSCPSAVLSDACDANPSASSVASLAASEFAKQSAPAASDVAAPTPSGIATQSVSSVVALLASETITQSSPSTSRIVALSASGFVVPPTSGVVADSEVAASSPSGAEVSANTGYTIFRGEKITLGWCCKVDAGDSSSSLTLHERGQPRSQKNKHKIITGQKSRAWLEEYITNQAERDEIMVYGSSNMNESIHNVYTVKADKRHDFR